jgi:hypothetical protein
MSQSSAPKEEEKKKKKKDNAQANGTIPHPLRFRRSSFHMNKPQKSVESTTVEDFREAIGRIF